MVSYNKYPLVLRTSPSSRLGRSLQPNHAHSRSKRNRKESPGPPHRSGTTRFPLSLIIDTTDSCCAAGSADIVGWTASASLVLAAHEPATRTCTLILRACDCSRRFVVVDGRGGSRRGNVTTYSSNRHSVRDQGGAVACWAGRRIAIAANTTTAAQVVCRAHVEASRAAVIARGRF